MNGKLEMLACRLKGQMVSTGAAGLAKIKDEFFCGLAACNTSLSQPRKRRGKS